MKDERSTINISSEENHHIHNNHTIYEITPPLSVKQNLFYQVINHHYFVPFIYAIAGLLLLGVLIIMFNTYILRVKVESAVVTAPIETVIAPVNGYIADVFVVQGQQVKKGDPLVKIDNMELERDMQLARVQFEESKLTAEYYQTLLANEQQRLHVYQHIGSSRVESAKNLVTTSKQDMITAQHHINRMKVLHDKHYISDAVWEDEYAKYIGTQERFKSAKAQHTIEHHSLNAVGQGLYFTGAKIEGTERDLSAELVAAQKKAVLNEERVKIYENLIRKLTLKAPFDGKITQLFKSAGNTTDTHKPILFIEQIKINKSITAYLTQSEVTHIASAKNVKIYIPSIGKTYSGRITELNRTDGFVDAVKAQYSWRDFDMDRSARVTIELLQSDQKSFDKKAFPGMPVIVYFSRRLT